MPLLANCHVIDPNNIGDLLSSPVRYFSFPTFEVEQFDIRNLQPELLQNRHLIVGGGGLLFPRFLESFSRLAATSERGKLIAWGIGQQIYGKFNKENIKSFDYAKYLDPFALIGIRDFESGYFWVPCASCMHSAFDRKREIKHEFVIFSHKKFQLKIDPFPRMTHEENDLETILDFLASGETILTSSYHGAYWGTLLGRKVLAFPFSSKFGTFKHQPQLYPVTKWNQAAKQFSLFNRVIYEFRYKNKYSCNIDKWQEELPHCRAYPESLPESRAQNQAYHTKVMNLLTE